MKLTFELQERMVQATGVVIQPPQAAISIALVEDEPIQRALVAAALEADGFRVLPFADTLSLRRGGSLTAVQLIVLDWTLPNESGIEFLDWLKQSRPDTPPIIFLTANEEAAALVRALSSGADDYIVKPAKPGELSARVQAVLRRYVGERDSGTIRIGRFELDAASSSVRVDGESVPMTQREFELAFFLFLNVGKIVTRHTLTTRVWNTSSRVSTRSIDTFASRIRKKLELAGDKGWILEGIYQQGYRLRRVEGMDLAVADSVAASAPAPA